VTAVSAAWKPGPKPSERPTPREIRALKAVQDGAPLSQAATGLGLTSRALASILSAVYARLQVKDRGGHHLSQDRRRMAIEICQQNGWWDE
jgi:DNA-binding NarL/FixJ family response regulator